jgi:predicted dehydrogenase
MAPIRVGIVGLSTNPSGSSWAKTAHLPYLKANPHYEITGVLNSSLQSSQSAVREFDLSATAKAYGDIDTMASDPDIDLIVVCVEVSKHAIFVRPALEQGKRVYCEWPLGKNYEEARELADLAASKGVKAYVGIESRSSPPYAKLRELVSSGAIGEVTSTTVSATFGPPPKVWSEKALFSLDKNSGQSPLHTRVAHFIDGFSGVLGEFEIFQSLLGTHQKEVKVYDVPLQRLAEATKDLGVTFRTVERSAPDEIILQGKLTTGAMASIHIRSGENDADGNMLIWTITGSQGLIEVTQKNGPFLRDPSVCIKLVKAGKVHEETLDWDPEGEFNMFGDRVMLATPARHYKAIAENDEDALITFEYAARRHKMLDRITSEK